MPRISSGRLLAAALAFSLIAAACTANPAATSAPATTTVTIGSTVMPSSPSHSSAATEAPAVSSATTSTGTATPNSTAPASSPVRPTASAGTASTTVIPQPRVTSSPADAAIGISPTAPVTTRAQNGIFTNVTLTNPEGRAVKGALAADKKLWTSAEPLGYGRRYTLTSTAAAPGGQTSRAISAFTTLEPAETIYPSFFPNPGMKTVGVGQPMVVIFDKPPADKVAAEKALSVKTVPAAQGSWLWWDDRTLHYRAKDYWKAGTKITVSANIYGVDLSGGAYGETDRSMTITIGPAKIAQADDATKQMQVFIDGRKVRTIPVSLGQDKQLTVDGRDISLVTPSGVYVAQEKYLVKQMTSASYGLPQDSPLGYDSKIPLAVRFSNKAYASTPHRGRSKIRASGTFPTAASTSTPPPANGSTTTSATATSSPSKALPPNSRPPTDMATGTCPGTSGSPAAP